MCEKIGEINRFGEKKENTCLEYWKSKHQIYHNPNFDYSKFCNDCKKLKLKTELNEVLSICSSYYPALEELRTNS